VKFVRRNLGAAAEVSHPGPAGMRREIAILFGATAVLLLAVYFLIGWAVELILPRISVARESEWFRGFSLADRVVEPIAAEEQSRVATARQALARLAAQPGVPCYDYRLVLIGSDTPNAFAFPGGTIGVTRGMLKLLDEEVAIAFVLGHELGHFAQRDHLRGVGRKLGRSLVWALMFSETGDTLTQNTGTLLELAHSRRQERGADHFGVELVQGAYGRLAGTEKLFVWLEQRQHQPDWTEWLQTHPVPATRIKELRDHVERLEHLKPSGAPAQATTPGAGKP
jgi:Zn-dependent protease with chaperone function